MQKVWKKVLSYAGIIVLFLALAYGFVPQVLSGKIVNQSDISGYVGMAHEANQWNAEHPDDRTAWTNSMFGGMPTVMLTGNPEGDWTQWLYDALLTGKRPATYLFISLLGAFLLMLSLGVNTLLAIGGAIAITFCSYNFQIIQVGHNTKMMAIAYMPWVLAAVIFTYRSALKVIGANWKSWLPKTMLGSALFGMALNFQIKANHIQISYYLAIIIFCYVIGLFIWLVADKERRSGVVKFLTASLLLLVIGIAGIGTNTNKLLPTYKYSHQTMRGGSELSSNTDGSKSKGLDLEYATAWSYGWEELPNLMIPNFNGGSSSGAVNPAKSETVKLLKRYGQPNTREIAKALPLYWGPQPFTAGPMYMGAITIFLFLLGLFLCEGKDKWWMLAATIIVICLGVGSHFMPFTKFWYYHMPMYSKFRTVSMALVALQLVLPMLGFVALDKVLKGEYSARQFKKPGLWALGISAGFCLLAIILKGCFRFSAASDPSMPVELVSALQKDRMSLMTSDALMSMCLIAATFLIILWAYAGPKDNAGEGGKTGNRSSIAAGAICLLVFINMFAVGKRYLNSEHFVTPRNFNGQFAERPVDKVILEDKALDYRVLDLTVNVFNDSHPSYLHKNIGGYSPVKMQRYQDLIDRHLQGEINTVIKAINACATMDELMANFPETPVLAMLNNKYIILDGKSAPVVNPNAFGNAWFVEYAVKAGSAEEEISLLADTDLHRMAVVGPDFGWAADAINAIPDNNKGAETWLGCSDDMVYMTSYAPNELHYNYSASVDRTIVFSEIYYPEGWHLTLVKNGEEQEIELFRADWTLRGAIVPEGEGELVMRFEPKSYTIGSNVSRASSALLYLILVLSASAVALTKREERA